MKRAPKVVVITGASAGVGRATAHRFAKTGARVALLARESDALHMAAKEVSALGGQALALPVDVADAEAVEACAERVESEFGPIDVWINAAMATIFAPAVEISTEEFRRATDVTYLGTVYGTLAALKRMRPRQRGCIIQVGSALAYRAIPLQAPYCGAKFAIRGFTDAVRVELMHEHSRVHITMVQLSAFNTPQFEWARCKLPRHPQPVPPIFQPELAADAIYWSSRHRRREVCVGFPAWKAIYGNKWFPRYADRVLAQKGYRSQMTEERLFRDRSGNLYQPRSGDPGTHGRFDASSKRRSAQWWLTSHRSQLIGAGAVALVWLGLSCLRSRHSRDLTH